MNGTTSPRLLPDADLSMPPRHADEELVGRDDERAVLAASAAEAAAGRGSIILVSGEAGVGKTALARAVLAHGGLRLFEGAGVQTGGRAFGPLVDVLRSYLRSAGPIDRSLVADHIAGAPLGPRLAPLLPELGAAAPDVDGAAPDVDGVAPDEALVQAFTTLARRHPTCLFLDDLHWADDATLEVLPALARRLGDVSLLVVGAFRSDELPRGHAVRRLRSELRRSEQLHQLLLEPLGPAATAALVAATIGAPAPALARAVFDRTDGVPFFVKELATALAAGGRLQPGPSGLELAGGDEVPLPESVRDAVLLRASGLSDTARQAVLAASVAGQSFDPELVALVAGLPEWPDELARLGVVSEGADDRMAFRHALVRDAFYGEITWSARIALHRAVAERLEAGGAPAVTVAEHWIAGRRPDRARACFLVAADSFRAVHAYRDAARAVRRALDLWPENAEEAERLDVLERLADCAELAGNLAEAVPVRREAAEGLRRAGDGLGAARAHRRLAAALELQGRWPEALASREQAASAFAAADHPAEAALERLTAAAHLRSAGSFRAALSLLELAGPEARGAGRLDIEARILGLDGNVRARMGEGPAAVEIVRRGLALALEHGFAGPAAEIYQRLADSLEHSGDYPGAQQTYDEAFTFCSTNGLEPTAQLCLACLTAVLRQSGDWDRAAALCRQIIGSTDATAHARAVATGMLGTILALRGQTRRSRPLLLEAVTLARRIELAAMEMLGLWGLALADEHDGDTQAAAGHCRALLDRWRSTEDRHYVVSALRWATTFFAESGGEEGVRTCAATLAAIAAHCGDGETMSALSHALGEIALLDGNAEQASAHFDRALTLLHAIDVPFDRAESGRRAAAALALAGRTPEAIDHLVAAHRTARRLGAARLVRRITDDLEALGERPDRRFGRGSVARAATGGLTRREVEVVRLVAVGRTNREIARELFLSPRTVEMHVSSIIGKLDCRSRADAARRATELGLLTT